MRQTLIVIKAKTKIKKLEIDVGNFYSERVVLQGDGLFPALNMSRGK